jgi:apolipoprotein N-acyltransferase
LRRLRLIKILGAGFAKNRFLNHFRYNRASLYPAGKKWVLWAAFAIVPYFYGTVQKLVVGPRLKTSSEIKVALIQTGLLPEQRDQLPFQTNAHIHPLIQWDRILTHLSTAKEERFDLIVLPEAAVSGGAKFTRYPLNSVQAIWQKHFGTGSPKVDFPLLSASFAKEVDEWNVSNSFWVQSLANHYGAQIVIGLDDWEEEAQYNAAFHFTPHCDYVERYEKQILIPGGEYIPLRHWKWVSRFFAEKMGVGASFKSGHASKVFFGNLPVGIFICLEETYSHLVREVRRAGAEIFVSISNDVWFPKTRLPWHHFDHGRIRAAEHGIWLLRSCNTGVTAAIDCFGQPIQIFPVSEESAGALIVKIPVQTYSTLYTYIGNWPIILASGAFFSFLAVRRLRRKKKLP